MKGTSHIWENHNSQYSNKTTGLQKQLQKRASDLHGKEVKEASDFGHNPLCQRTMEPHAETTQGKKL